MFPNLISISQFCDQGFIVHFSKDKCEVLDSKKHAVMNGTRLSDNCYHWDNNFKNLKWNLSKSNKTMLWHKRLRHMSISIICNDLKAEAIHEVSLLKQSINNLCSECSAGKQIKASDVV